MPPAHALKKKQKKKTDLTRQLHAHSTVIDPDPPLVLLLESLPFPESCTTIFKFALKFF